MDIGAVIQAPMDDKDWLKKCALMGLLFAALCLIPLVGGFLAYFNLIGWVRAYTEARVRGESELPPANLGYLGSGFSVFVMYLPLAGLVLAIVGVTAAFAFAGARMHSPGLAVAGSVLACAAIFPLALWMAVMRPGIDYLFFVRGEPWASIKLGHQWRTMMAGGVDYLLFWVAIVLAGIIAQVGLIACGVGLLVSLPYGMLMIGAAIAEFDKAAGARMPTA